MEHRLILGGEQYLAFAQGRIRALRAAGIRFIAHRWIMPGGENVAIRIDGDHEYIQIDGGGSLLTMDSGVIDLKGVEANAPARYTNATRGETTSTAAYDVPYTLGATGSTWSTWKSDPTQRPNGQITGTVEVPAFAGHLRVDATRADSFTAARKPADPQTTPPSWVYQPKDDVLAAKKYMASKCPASIFTGRTRLYVQAMYGRPLYEYGSDGSMQPKAGTIGQPSLASLSPPSLSLPVHKAQDDKTVYLPVVIDTSAGVYFDATTGKHWLLLIAGAALTAYPLVSSPAGESVRKYLAGAKIGKGPDAAPLNAGDIEKLEAYVLAYCLPDAKNAKVIDIGQSTGSAFSMGYGWHWNWSGTAADIVTHSNFPQAPINTGGTFIAQAGMLSTHKRITVAVTHIDGTPVFTPHMSVIENNVPWAVHRGYWCITFPVWGAMLTEKLTPKNSELMTCDAPFYAFYKRDELQLCRVKVDQAPAVRASRSHSFAYADDGYGNAIARVTAGMLDGFCYDVGAVAPFFKATFSCANLIYADLNMPWSSASSHDDVTKTGFSNGTFHFDNTFLGSHDFTTGYPDGFGSYTTTTVSDCLTENDDPPTVFYKHTSLSRVTTSTSTATMIVPFYDAEAIYMEGTQYIETFDSGITVTTNQGTAYGSQASQWVLTSSDPITGAHYSRVNTYIKWLAAGVDGQTSITNPPDSTVDTANVLGTKLVCRAGVIDATMGDLGSYHDNSLDEATVNYGALVGAAATSPVAIAPTRITAVGVVDPVIPQYPAIVGWV